MRAYCSSPGALALCGAIGVGKFRVGIHRVRPSLVKSGVHNNVRGAGVDEESPVFRISNIETSEPEVLWVHENSGCRARQE